MSDVRQLINICKKLSPSDLSFILKHGDSKLDDSFSEILFNIIHNEKVFDEIKKNKKYFKLKKDLHKNKKEILSIFKSKSRKKRKEYIRNQAGEGIFGLIAPLLLSILPSIFK